MTNGKRNKPALIQKNALNLLSPREKLSQLFQDKTPMVMLAVARQQDQDTDSLEFISNAVRKGCFNWLTVQQPDVDITACLVFAASDRGAALVNFAGYLVDSLKLLNGVLKDDTGISRLTRTADNRLETQFLTSTAKVEDLMTYLGMKSSLDLATAMVNYGKFPVMYSHETSSERVSRLVFYRTLEVATEQNLDFSTALADGTLRDRCFKDVYNNPEQGTALDTRWQQAALAVETLCQYYPENSDLYHWAVCEELKRKMKVEKIYFDMDGVLADFVKGAEQALGKAEYTDDEMWEAVSQVPNFFNTLDPIPGAKALFDQLYARYGDRCEILTALPKERRGIASAEDDKIAWVRRVLSPDIKINAVKAKREKQAFCNGMNTILIDDWSDNIKAWRKAGGLGIQFTDADAVIETLKSIGVL